jgi:phosphopantetheinyl transferase (holo-ACP synthase)
MAMLEEESAKRKAIENAKAEEKRKIDIEGIAKEWATKEYTLRMLNGDIDDSLSEKDFLISVWDQALAEGTKAYDFINSEEYELEKERKQKAMVDVEDRLFWDGMPPLMRKKREKMVEKVKKQYMDLLSEEELERIILTSE